MNTTATGVVTAFQGDSSPRLLLIIPHMEVGGADKWNLELVARLSRVHGYTVTIVTTEPAENQWFDRFRELTGDIHVLPGFLGMKEWPRFLKHLVESRLPSVIMVSNSRFGYDIAPFLRANFPTVPFVDYVHMEEPDRRDGGYAMDSVRHSATFDRTGVTSEHLRRWMISAGVEPRKIHTVYINVDECLWSRNEEESAKARGKWRLPPGTPVVLYVCRLVDQKQPAVFAATVERLISSGLESIFVIAGTGPGESEIHRLVSRHPNQVRYVGSRSPDEIRELFACADLLFIPSAHEGIALAYYEAMSMGVVPVGADVGGQRELITRECGLLIRRGPDEALAYAQAIEGLLKDRARLDAMKVASRARILSRFTLDRMVSDMVTLFREASEHAALAHKERMSPFESNAYAHLVVELHRLASLSNRLWTDSDEGFADRFRNSRLSPRFSKFKRGLLRFLMNHF